MVEKLGPSLTELKAARPLFPAGKTGQALYRAALQTYSPEDLLKLRKQYGEGQSGSQAFCIIATGATCEVKPASNNGQQCQNKGIGTVDFDVFATLEQTVFCQDHRLVVYNDVREALENSKPMAIAGMGVNGHGRH